MDMIWIYVTFVLIVIYLVAFIYSFFEKYWVEVKTYQITINKQAFHNYKIVFLTDFHHSEIVSQKFIRKVVNNVNQMHPDLIVLGGDYVSNKKIFVEPIFKELANLETQDGIYGVIGNHDIDVSKELVLECMEKANIKSLDNDAYWINKDNDRIRLGGVADYLFEKPDISKILQDVKDDDFVMVVSHNPDYIEKIKNDKIDVMLSGHTHGGQVTVFGLFAPYIPSEYHQKYRTGLKIVNKIKLIVSNGIGVVGLPIRFFARPQIVVIELINE